MSKYYGTLTSDKGTTTRAGHRYIRASAQSHDGNISVHIADGAVRIVIDDGSSIEGRAIFTGTLTEMLERGFTLRRGNPTVRRN